MKTVNIIVDGQPSEIVVNDGAGAGGGAGGGGRGRPPISLETLQERWKADPKKVLPAQRKRLVDAGMVDWSPSKAGRPAESTNSIFERFLKGEELSFPHMTRLIEAGLVERIPARVEMTKAGKNMATGIRLAAAKAEKLAAAKAAKAAKAAETTKTEPVEAVEPVEPVEAVEPVSEAVEPVEMAA